MALSHPDRVCEIDLVVTNSIIGLFAEMTQRPFLALEQFHLTSKDDKETAVHGELLGGSAPLLKEIKLGSIAVPFPAVRRLLLSTTDLVSLRLENIPNTGHFSPTALVTLLSSLSQLKELHVRFRFPVSRARSVTSRALLPPLALERAILPSITHLHFYMDSEYAEELCAIIDTPALATVTIKLFNQLIFEIPQVCRFISRMERIRSYDGVKVKPFDRSIHVELYFQEENSRDGWCILTVSCRQLDWQLSFATQVLSQLSPFLSSVKTLRFPLVPRDTGFISTGTGIEDVDPTQWLELFQSLSHVSDVRVDEKELVSGIVHALLVVSEDAGYMAAGLLPSLASLYLKGYHKSSSVKEASERFVAARKAAGRSISLLG
jgi:hypothetical protein